MLACPIGTVNRGFKHLSPQVSVVQTGQQGLLCGVNDDNGIGCFASSAFCILSALGNVGLAQSCQIFLFLNPYYGIIRGFRQNVTPLGLQVRDTQVYFLHSLHVFVREQSAFTYKFLISLFQKFAVLALKFIILTLIHLLDACK